MIKESGTIGRLWTWVCRGVSCRLCRVSKEVGRREGQWREWASSHLTQQHHTQAMHAGKLHASISLLVKTKFGLQTINMLLCHSCIFHCVNKHSPGGREALAVFPPDQPSLYCTLVIQRIASVTCFNCAWVKFYSFKNSSSFACGISAHILPKELEVVWTTYRDSMQDAFTFKLYSSQVRQITHSPVTLCDNTSSLLPSLSTTLGGVSTGKQRESVHIIQYIL